MNIFYVKVHDREELIRIEAYTAEQAVDIAIKQEGLA